MRHQRKKRAKKAYLLWAIALMLIVRVTVFVRPRSLDTFTEVDALALLNIVLVTVSFVVILPSLLKKRTLQLFGGSSFRFLIFYYLLCAMSGFWSENPFFSAYRSLEMVSQILLVSIAMAHAENYESAEKTFLFVGAFSIVAGIIMHLKVNDWVISRSSLHTNSYSVPAAMMVVYCLHEWLNAEGGRKKTLLYYLVLSGIATLVGTSSASIVAIIVGVAVGGVFQKKMRGNLFIVLFVAIALMIPLGVFDTYWQEILFPGKTEEAIVTLSGRANLWEKYYHLFEESPFIGYGFLIVARVGSQFGSINALSAHNGFFEVLLGTGIAGGFLFILWLIKLFIELGRTYKRYDRGIIGTIGAVSAVLINNLTIPVIGGAWNAMNTVFIAFLSLFVAYRVMEMRKDIGLKSKYD